MQSLNIIRQMQRRQGTQQCDKRDYLHKINCDDDYDTNECFNQDMDSQFENFVFETLDVKQNGIKDKIHATAVITTHCLR